MLGGRSWPLAASPSVLRFFVLKQIFDHSVELRTPDVPGDEILGSLYQHPKSYQPTNSSFKVGSKSLVVPWKKFAFNGRLPATARTVHKVLPRILFHFLIPFSRTVAAGRMRPILLLVKCLREWLDFSFRETKDS